MNDNTTTGITNLSVVTGSKLEESLGQIWDAMKQYIVTHEDISNLMTEVKAILDRANRQVIGTTGTQKAQAIETSVNSMVVAFENAGIDMTGVSTSSFPELISMLGEMGGVYILDENNLQWTAENWAFAKSQGQVMPNYVGILLVFSDGEIIISADGTTEAWGTYGVTLANLEGYSGGPIYGTPKSGLLNSRLIVAQSNPDLSYEIGIAIDYEDGVTTIDEITNAYCVRFTDSSAQLAFAQHFGLNQMNAWGQRKFYAYGTTGNWRTSYWKTNMTTIAASSFQQVYAQCPIADGYGNIASPSTEWCVKYKAYSGDTHNWYEPSIYELFKVALNIPAINFCLTALDKTTLATGNYYWSSLPYANGAYCIELASPTVSNYTKNNRYTVRAFTSR